jgi:hypothetical protein
MFEKNCLAKAVAEKAKVKKGKAKKQSQKVRINFQNVHMKGNILKK